MAKRTVRDSSGRAPALSYHRRRVSVEREGGEGGRGGLERGQGEWGIGASLSHYWCVRCSAHAGLALVSSDHHLAFLTTTRLLQFTCSTIRITTTGESHFILNEYIEQ